MKRPFNINRPDHHRGFTLIEVLMGLLISSILLLGIVQGFSTLVHTSSDQKLRTVAQLKAQTILDLMVPELRTLGNGVPFRQSNFLIAQADLADNTVTQPILTSGTTASQIQFRLNQTGETYILTADFDPSLTNSVTLTSVNKIYINDEIYITNSTVGEDDGFWGKISSINSGTKTVTFAGGSQYSTGATFPMGSLFEVVPIITYTSTGSYGGVTRNDGNGAISLGDNSQFTLTYLSAAGASISLPLVASSADPFPASAIQNVKAIKARVEVRSSKRLTDNEYYVAAAEQTVTVRNLNYKY